MEFHSLAAPHPESALVDSMPNYDRFPPHAEQRLPAALVEERAHCHGRLAAGSGFLLVWSNALSGILHSIHCVSV